MSYQKIVIAGNLGHEPEMRQTDGGKSVCNFSVAVSDRKDNTEWFRVVAWDKLGEICKKYLDKGSKVIVDGRIASRQYTDKNGVQKTTFDVVANDVRFLGKPATQQEPELEVPF